MTKEERFLEYKIALEERLSEYKRALFHYRMSRYIPLYKHFAGTQFGFCNYFNCADLYEYYPELEEFNPNNYGSYWFESVLLKPRINCLKKAIELTEKKLTELMLEIKN